MGRAGCRVPHAQALGVLVRSLVVEREPIYRAQETAAAAPSLKRLNSLLSC